LTGIHFQTGAVKEHGLNGVFMEDLISVCINRLENFQDSKFECKENEKAIKSLYDALFSLNERTKIRKARGVEGTMKK
jgi:hypothetical protein